MTDRKNLTTVSQSAPRANSSGDCTVTGAAVAAKPSTSHVGTGGALTAPSFLPLFGGALLRVAARLRTVPTWSEVKHLLSAVTRCNSAGRSTMSEIRHRSVLRGSGQASPALTFSPLSAGVTFFAYPCQFRLVRLGSDPSRLLSAEPALSRAKPRQRGSVARRLSDGKDLPKRPCGPVAAALDLSLSALPTCAGALSPAAFQEAA